LKIRDRLHHDELFDAYTSTLDIAGIEVRLTLYANADDDLEPALRRAREILTNLTTCEREVREHAVEALLSLKNEAWLEEGDSPITEGQFRQQMTLETIVFYPEGDVTFYYQDGGLFWGHTIEVGLDAEGNFTHADIPG
jgi:hypothetical protein